MPANQDRNRRRLTWVVVALLSLAVRPASGASGDDVEARTKRARGGGGIRAGTWQVQNLDAPATGTSSESGSYEGWFQKGLDMHLALESTIGFWQRTQSSTEPGSLGSETQTENKSYLVPSLTSLKIYPLTRPSSPLEPYVSAGIGIVLGIDRVKVTSDDPLVTPGETTAFLTGLGIQTGGGIDWNPGGPFGVTVGGRYQWASFGEDIGGKRLYRGPAMSVGLTYHFQYN